MACCIVVVMHNARDIEKRQEALTLKLEGMTYQQIASKLGLSRQRIQQLIAPPEAIRNLVYDRAKGVCEVCGIRVGRTGHIHHAGGKYETYNDLVSLQLLCPSCHRAAHRGPATQTQVKKKEPTAQDIAEAIAILKRLQQQWNAKRKQRVRDRLTLKEAKP